MVGEFITREFAIEGNMTIFENDSTSYVEQHDRWELAFISPADDKTDDVVVVPGSKLRKPGDLFSHDDVPVDIEVKQIMPNSQLHVVEGTRLFRELLKRKDDALKLAPPAAKAPPASEHPADTGLGKESFLVPMREGVGVDPEAKFDFPSAYLAFKDKKTGKDLGTYLLSTWLPLLSLPDQKIQIDGKTYEVSLRYKRSYKPYTMHLIKVTTKFYPGTDKAKDYNSLVRLVDPTHNEDRQLTILMNQPLRYRGETFYQASVLGRNGTVLQVVRNPGWVLPYLSCIVVGLGMLVHFTLNLSTFLNRRAAS
jgi:ResB-like family